MSTHVSSSICINTWLYGKINQNIKAQNRSDKSLLEIMLRQRYDVQKFTAGDILLREMQCKKKGYSNVLAAFSVQICLE